MWWFDIPKVPRWVRRLFFCGKVLGPLTNQQGRRRETGWGWFGHLFNRHINRSRVICYKSFRSSIPFRQTLGINGYRHTASFIPSKIRGVCVAVCVLGGGTRLARSREHKSFLQGQQDFVRLRHTALTRLDLASVARSQCDLCPLEHSHLPIHPMLREQATAWVSMAHLLLAKNGFPFLFHE